MSLFFAENDRIVVFFFFGAKYVLVNLQMCCFEATKV